MLAARDQENLVHGLQQVAASKPLNQTTRGLQPKTPGARSKTPLKIPLHDENAPGGFGGKSGKGKGIENMMTAKGKGITFDKNAFVTPMGPRIRAPLGMKTTNAKAKAFQTPGLAPEKEPEKTIAPKTSARRPKKVIHGDTVKVQVHSDESPLAEREMEYCPPRPIDLPYESEDFPDGCLNYNVLKPGNLMRGFYNTHHNAVDDNGKTRMDLEYEESYKKSAAACDARVLKMMEEDWTVGDVPETFHHITKKKAPIHRDPAPALLHKKTTTPTKGPATIASRRAASALSVVPKSTPAPPQTSKPVAKPSNFLSRPKPNAVAPPVSTTRHNAAAAASRSTLGYNKGRTASSVLQQKPSAMPNPPPQMQTVCSNLSQASDVTITPARFAEKRSDKETGPGSEAWRRLDFLRAFDHDSDDEELEPGLRGALPDCLRGDDDDEEFVMTLGPAPSTS